MLLEELHRLIPSARNLFDWTDAEGNLVRYYFEGPIDQEVARLYFEEFHNAKEGQAMTGFREAVTGRAHVQSAAELDTPEFRRSALYNEIWRPQGLDSRIEAVVRGIDGRPLGSLVLYRGPRDPPFTADDESLLGRLVPYVSRALETPPQAVREYTAAAAERAVLSLSSAGELLHLSRDAHKMLMLAHGGISPASVSSAPRVADFPTLSALCHQLRRHDEQRSTGVTLTLENSWGRFHFDGQVLVPVHDSLPVILVTIERYGSRAMGLRRALTRLPLSNAQREVCILLHAGQTQREIANALGVAVSTVSDHVRSIHTRLDVHSTQELITLIERTMPPG